MLDSKEKIQKAIKSCNDSGDLYMDFWTAINIIFDDVVPYEGQEEDREFIIELGKTYLQEVETEIKQRCGSWKEFYVSSAPHFVEWYHRHNGSHEEPQHDEYRMLLNWEE
jgi:hypothetical protein